MWVRFRDEGEPVITTAWQHPLPSPEPLVFYRWVFERPLQDASPYLHHPLISLSSGPLSSRLCRVCACVRVQVKKNHTVNKKLCAGEESLFFCVFSFTLNLCKMLFCPWRACNTGWRNWEHSSQYSWGWPAMPLGAFCVSAPRRSIFFSSVVSCASVLTEGRASHSK